jgi:tRNA(Arg) A34 adenosine deaminase TadA
MDALEYTRVIHAEMNALCDAARLGRNCCGAVLYCTTFPCHMCAKHIIAAGMSQVIFLEPYPKSLTFQLHNDAVQIEGGDRGQYTEFPSVQFLHFYGVTPRRYQELFQRGKRKSDDGKFLEYRANTKQPFISLKTPAYTLPEGMVLKAQKKKYKEVLGLDEAALNGEA